MNIKHNINLMLLTLITYNIKNYEINLLIILLLGIGSYSTTKVHF